MIALYEIESCRMNIQEAQVRQLQGLQTPRTNSLPEGFYNPGELERFTRSNEIIYKTVTEFMGNIGVDFDLQQEFELRRYFLGRTRKMYYALTLNTADCGLPVHELFRTRGIAYDVGKRRDRESLTVYALPFLVPQDKRNSFDIDAREALTYLMYSMSRRATILNIGQVHTPVNYDGICGLLSVIMCDPLLPLTPAKATS